MGKGKRKTVIFQLEGIYNNQIVQLPDQSRDDQKLSNVIKGIVQVCLDRQAWDIDHISRKSVPRFYYHLGKEILPNSRSKPPLMKL